MMQGFKGMDFLAVAMWVIGACTAVCAVGNNCLFPTTTSSSTKDLPYVETESENDDCVYNPSVLHFGFRCSPGSHCNPAAGGSPCLSCPFNETLKTFQPQDNYCPKCILCRVCEDEGMETVSECTRESDTVCRNSSSDATGGQSSTTEVATYSPSPSPSTSDEGPSSTSTPMSHSNQTNTPGVPTGNQPVQNELRFILCLVLSGVLLFTLSVVVCRLCCMRRKDKQKIRKLKKGQNQGNNNQPLAPALPDNNQPPAPPLPGTEAGDNGIRPAEEIDPVIVENHIPPGEIEGDDDDVDNALGSAQPLMSTEPSSLNSIALRAIGTQGDSTNLLSLESGGDNQGSTQPLLPTRETAV